MNTIRDHSEKAKTGRFQSFDAFLNYIDRDGRRKRQQDDSFNVPCRVTGHGKGKGDAHPSVNVRLSGDKILVTCHAGCITKEVLAAWDLTMADLFLGDHVPDQNVNKPKIAATFDYRDAENVLKFQAVRREPGEGGKRKDFQQRRPDPVNADKWIWNMDGVERILYRLPQLLNAAETDPGGERHIAEGERKADKLASLGFVTTCNVGGAGKWNDGYSRNLAGCNVAIWKDRDSAGEKHAAAVAKSLHDIAASVKIVLPPEPHHDIEDWIDAGATAEQIKALVDATPIYMPSAEPEALMVDQVDDAVEDACAGIVPIDAVELVHAHLEMRAEVIEGLLREREIMAFVSSSKHGKTFLMLLLALCLATGRMFLGFPVRRCNVLIIDLELHRQTLACRLAALAKAIGILEDEYKGRIKIIPLRGNLKRIDEMDLLMRRSTGYGVIIIDSIYRAWPKGMDENSNADVTAVFNQLDTFTDLTGAAIIAVHHASKGNQSNKAIVDVGSGAGAMARAVDTHCILRAHEQDDCAVLEAVARTHPPIQPMGLRWQYPLWAVDESLDTSKLREPGQKTTTPDWTVERFATHCLNGRPLTKDVIVAKAEAAGVPARKALQLFAMAVSEELIVGERDGVDRRKMLYRKKSGL